MTTILLSGQKIACERGYRQLFHDVNFQISAGQVLRIAGPNGSGKSTLLKIIAGITSNFQGEFFWRENAMRDAREDFLANMSFLGHSKAVKSGLTASENLHFFAALYPCKPDVSVSDALTKAGLNNFQHTLCGQLSAGQQQRVALARLMMSAACLWILDEPFTAIDREGVREFENLISDFVSNGGAVIITTHHSLQLACDITTLELGN